MKSEPCALCGHTEMNLVDGFYYCEECGTQDINLRETIVEQKTIGDGTFATFTKRKLVNVTGIENEMSAEWYKWHAYNFILVGFADELIHLGANPSFKTKLMWIWTRYIKMYQDKEELGLLKDTEKSITIESLIEARSTRESTSVSGKPEEECNKEKKSKSKDYFYWDINEVTKSLIISMLYLALHLDRSDIQLSHIFRFLKEGRISFLNLNKYVPEDFNFKAVPRWNIFLKMALGKQHQLRYITMTLIKKLDLGIPLVPDLRKILKNIIKELCLPYEVYILACSLMHLCPCNFTVTRKHIAGMVRIPDYEAIVMSYVLVALKMCFGLDDNYEFELSNVVEKFNETNNLERSYKFGISSYTKRLFSFREWCNYLRARKIMLSKHCLMMTEIHSPDMDDYVFVEHLQHRPELTVELTDKIAMEILEKIPQDYVRVIPKDEFPVSFTPMSTYTQVMLDHSQDPEFKYLLSEDFSQYSLKYACEDLELIDIEKSENIVVGVSESKKKLNPRIQGVLEVKKTKFKMVYVKSCDNKNWMKTNKPTIDHVVESESNEISVINENNNDKNSDHGYDASLENGKNDNETPKSNDNDTHILEESNDMKLEMIEEEEEGKNIFDDEFVDLDCNADENNDENNFNGLNGNNLTALNENNNKTHNATCYDYEDDEDSHLSDITLNDCSKYFDPETFDREKSIKHLLLAACKNYKIPIPKELRDPHDQVRTRIRKRKIRVDIPGMPRKKKKCKPGQLQKEVDILLNAYHEHLEKDVLHKVSEEVRNVLHNINMTQGNNTENNFEHLQNNTNEDMHYEESNINIETNLEQIENDKPPNPDSDKTIGSENNIASALCDHDDSDEGVPDWRTKGDPKFDEKKYDVNQLYIKLEDQTLDDRFSIDDCPVLEEILTKKIKDIQKNPNKFMNLRRSYSKQPKCLSSDSEDDLPLNELQKEKKFFEEMRKKEKEVKEPLIKKKIPVFKYWWRHYMSGNNLFTKNMDLQIKFEQELTENLPGSFSFVIHECASILNCSAFHLYKHLQNLEKMLGGRPKNASFDDF